jgi:hypothetical protein
MSLVYGVASAGCWTGVDGYVLAALAPSAAEAGLGKSLGLL